MEFYSLVWHFRFSSEQGDSLVDCRITWHSGHGIDRDSSLHDLSAYVFSPLCISGISRCVAHVGNRLVQMQKEDGLYGDHSCSDREELSAVLPGKLSLAEILRR